jgi:hypothetical protein
MHEPSQILTMVYKNYRGEVAVRRVLPKCIWFGQTEHHLQPQWLMNAVDVERGVERTFAMQDIQTMFPPPNKVEGGSGA